MMKSSSTPSGSSEEPSDSDVARLSAMQNVFLFLKVHVDLLYQTPLSRKMMLEYISVALYDNDLNPTEIVDYIGKTPRTLPTGEELIKLRQFNRSTDSNGIQYGEKRPAALNLCEEVMNLCIDVYLHEVSQDTCKEETKRIKDVPVATTHTTAISQKVEGKAVETKFNPTEEFMKHATPSITSTSYHPAKLQTCVPPLKRSNGSNPKLPNVIAPSTVPKNAYAQTGTTQDLLSMAKEIHAEADLISKRLNKPAAIDSLPQPVRKPQLFNNVVSHVQLPSTNSIFKNESRPLYTQSKQGKSPFENPKIFNFSYTAGGLNNESMNPLYSRLGSKEVSLWKADPIYAMHDLPTQKSFSQELSDQLDNPPFVDRALSASLWSKKNMVESDQSALLDHRPKPGDVVKDEKLVGNAYDLERNFDITDVAAVMAVDLAAMPLRQKVKRSDDIAKDEKRVGKTVSIKSERLRIAETAKDGVEQKAAKALALAFSSSTQKLEKPSLPGSKVSGLKLGNVFKDGKLVRNTVDPNCEAAIHRAGNAAGLTPTQRIEEALLPAVNVHGSKPGDFLENRNLVGNTVDPKRPAIFRRAKERAAALKRERDATVTALTPTQKFEKTLTEHAGSKMPSGFDTLAPAGNINSRLTAYVKSMKVARAAEKDIAPKSTDRVPAVKKEFKQGPVTPLTKEQFEQGRARPQKKKPEAPKKKEISRATWTENGDDGEPSHWVKIATVPVFLFLLCTIIQIMMNLGTIMSTICNVVAPCLALFMDCTRYFWSGVWWLIKSPFLLFGYIGGMIGGFVIQDMGIRPGHAVAPPSAPPIIIEPGLSTISAMQETIFLWDALGAEKAKHPQWGNSLQISSEVSADSPTGIRYKSDHRIGNSGWGTESDYPFTRHNNSMPEADRCEHFVKSFRHFWKEEMEEKKEKEGKEGRLDLALGNELAEVLSRYCK